MPKIARGRGTGANRVTSPSGNASPSAGGPSPEAGRAGSGGAGARGEPVEDGAGSEGDHLAAPDLAGARVGGAGRQEGGESHGRMIPCRGVQIARSGDDDVPMDVGAIKAAAAASAASYRSFADATRSVLDLLER